MPGAAAQHDWIPGPTPVFVAEVALAGEVLAASGRST
jgi:hypothetical protein